MTDGITVSHSGRQVKLVWRDVGSGVTKTARGEYAVVYPDSGVVIFRGEAGEIILNGSVEWTVV